MQSSSDSYELVGLKSFAKFSGKHMSLSRLSGNLFAMQLLLNQYRRGKFRTQSKILGGTFRKKSAVSYFRKKLQF